MEGFKWVLTFSIFFLLVVFLFRARQEKNRYFSILMALGSLYGIGKYLQFWHIGPMIARCYISDIGFVPMFACLPLVLAYDKRRLFTATRFAFFGLLVAVLVEIAELYANPHIPKGQFGTRGDWVDLAIFVLSYLFVQFFFLRGLYQSLIQKEQLGKKKRKRR